MYLVMLHHGMDDLPLAMFEFFDEANAFAQAVKPMPTDAIRGVFKTDCSTPDCVSVVQFARAAMPPALVPVKKTVVRTFDEPTGAVSEAASQERPG